MVPRVCRHAIGTSTSSSAGPVLRLFGAVMACLAQWLPIRPIPEEAPRGRYSIRISSGDRMPQSVRPHMVNYRCKLEAAAARAVCASRMPGQVCRSSSAPGGPVSAIGCRELSSRHDRIRKWNRRRRGADSLPINTRCRALWHASHSRARVSLWHTLEA